MTCSLLGPLALVSGTADALEEGRGAGTRAMYTRRRARANGPSLRTLPGRGGSCSEGRGHVF
jgi:hypothetical protein